MATPQVQARRGMKVKSPLTSKRRNRKEVKIRYVDPDGKIVDDDIVTHIRRVMVQDATAFREIAEKANVCPSTASKMFYGDTRQPRHGTLIGLLGAYGYQMVIHRKKH